MASIKAILGRSLVILLTASAAVYLADWAVWRARVAAGGGMGTVNVGVMITTPLKNQKEEYDWAGVQPIDCSRSLFPHEGNHPCWWLKRQKAIEER